MTQPDFDATALDIFGWLAGEYTAQNHLALRLDFSGKLDHVLLTRAVAAAAQSNPILSRRFVTSPEKASWQIVGPAHRGYSIADLPANDEALPATADTFLNEPLDRAAGRLLEVAIVSGSRDTLVIKADHACTDAAGLVKFTTQVAGTYTAFLAHTPTANPVLSPRLGLDDVLRQPGIREFAATFKPTAPAPATVHFSVPDHETDTARLASRTLPSATLERLIAHTHQAGSTLNDILVGAFSRALHAVATLDNSVATLGVTVDLRRYLNSTSADLTNLSTGINVVVPISHDHDFNATLSQVATQTAQAKAHWPGVPAAILLNFAFGLAPFSSARTQFAQRRAQAQQSGKSIPYLSNLGRINTQDFCFGPSTPANVLFVGPAMRAPGLLLAAATYQQALTLTVRHYPTGLPTETVETLLNFVVDELHKA